MTDRSDEIKRPPVLSDEQIDAAWPSEAGDGFPEHSVDTIDALTLELMRCAKVVAEAQRDADVEWFRKSKCEHCDTPLLREGELYEKLAQARREAVYAMETLLKEEVISLYYTRYHGDEMVPKERVSLDILRRVLEETDATT